jgi:DNA-binding NarL/FixJ family response regulator
MSSVADPIGLVEAAYEDLPREEWTRGLLERTLPLVPGAVAPGCYTIDMSVPTAPKLSSPVVMGLPPEFAAQWVDSLTRSDASLHTRAYSRKVGTLSDLAGGRASAFGPPGELAEQYGGDAFYCAALDAEGRGLVLAALLPTATRLARRTRTQWSLLAAHVAAAERLKRRVQEQPQDECVLSAGGRVEHAEGDATPARAQECLRAAVVARDKARTRAVRSNPEEALALWQGLVEGRWSLLDRFESDGRRYVVARRNEPDPPNPLALTLRERQVLWHLVQGDAMKVVGYALGIKASALSIVAKSLLLKLGVRSVTELAGLVALAGAGAAEGVRYGEEDLLVVSSPLAGRAPDGLTHAQLEIASAVARGESNATIARNRGTSVHTVANQVATILARLGVGSRQQIAIAVSRAPRHRGG